MTIIGTYLSALLGNSADQLSSDSCHEASRRNCSCNVEQAISAFAQR
jgi:hypothetical protein